MDSTRENFRKLLKPTNYFGSSNNKKDHIVYDDTLRLLKNLANRRSKYDTNLIISFVKCLEEDNTVYQEDRKELISKLDEIYRAYKFPYCLDTDIDNRTNAILKCIIDNYQLICNNRTYLIQRPCFPPDVSICVTSSTEPQRISLANYNFCESNSKNQEMLNHIREVYQSESFCNYIQFDSEMNLSDYLYNVREKINNTNGIDKACFVKPVNLLDNSFRSIKPLYEKLKACYDAFISTRPATYRPKTDSGKKDRDNFLKIKSKWTDILCVNQEKLIESYSQFSDILHSISDYYDYLEYYINPNSDNKCTCIVPLQTSNDELDKIFDTITTIFNKDGTMIAMFFFFFDKRQKQYDRSEYDYLIKPTGYDDDHVLSNLLQESIVLDNHSPND